MLIQKCRKSFLLFNKNFKPGILCNGNYCIAVKCKLFGECFNFINEELLHVIGDKNLAHRACFCKSINEKYPTRICFYTEDGYIDMGWGLAKKIDSNGRYIFDISKEVKERYKDYEYPIYPGEIILKSNWTMFDNWIYESKLEAKYAKFFTLLGIPFVQQPPPIPSINSEWWRIDFMLWPLNEDKKCLVEIKPGRPYDIEEYKCEVASEYVSPIPIVLLYGEMEVPFLYDENKGILLMYNASNAANYNDVELPKFTYAAGQALFNPQFPYKLEKRTQSYFIYPDKDYEKVGEVNEVCFVEGLVFFKKKWFLYYGTADSKIAVAVFDPKAKN